MSKYEYFDTEDDADNARQRTQEERDRRKARRDKDQRRRDAEDYNSQKHREPSR